MVSSFLLGALSLLPLITASPTPTLRTRPCKDLTLSLSITATNSLYDIPRVENTIDAVDLVWNLDTWTSPSSADRIKGDFPINQTFTISAQLCVPKDSKKKGILQIATHGLGFDKQYWDSRIQPEKYSYVDAALNAGYSILTYDRLGVGSSDKPDAYKTVQTPVEVEILKELVLLARSGSLSLTDSNNKNTTFEKVVLVGHSLGSGLTLGLLTAYPSLADGAISTGLIPNKLFGQTGQRGFGLEFAPQSDPVRFGERSSGYLVQGTLGAVQQIFFKKGYFDEELLKYAESIKEAGTVGELVSLAAALGAPAVEYKGPLLFALGEYDFAICQGNCTGAYDLEALRNETFPAARNVDVHIQPGSGHALTMHTNATGHYQAIFDYLDKFYL
ncbi:Alpha/beta hydrolase family-domain-containing protein [Aspergillus filifer]